MVLSHEDEGTEAEPLGKCGQTEARNVHRLVVHEEVLLVDDEKHNEGDDCHEGGRNENGEHDFRGPTAPVEEILCVQSIFRLGIRQHDENIQNANKI